ncbi:MAG: hypothetical protein HYX29_01875 [Solirubrobacterales bacterium]|nr:hypothetical protein [Solirubrobacterales bacterium]
MEILVKKPTLRRVRSRLSYANIIATMALFIALGGVSWAAVKLPKNSVTTKTIKRSAVTSQKIKNKTIVGADVKSNTLTGTQINESTLTIPSVGFATSAGTAATAADTFSVVKSTRSSATNADEDIARAAATEVPLVSHGNVSLYAKCFIDTTANATHFEVIARTNTNGAIFQGYSSSDSLFGDPDLLNTATPENLRQITDDETDSANDIDDDNAEGVSLLGPDSKGLYFNVLAFGRNGAVATPPAQLPNDDSCFFQVQGTKLG